VDGPSFEETTNFSQRPTEIPVLLATNGDRAGARMVESHDHGHRRRLSRSVWSEESSYATRLNVEGEIVNGKNVPEALGKATSFNH
jgi:hypothetical protein